MGQSSCLKESYILSTKNTRLSPVWIKMKGLEDYPFTLQFAMKNKRFLVRTKEVMQERDSKVKKLVIGGN